MDVRSEPVASIAIAAEASMGRHGRGADCCRDRCRRRDRSPFARRPRPFCRCELGAWRSRRGGRRGLPVRREGDLSATRISGVATVSKAAFDELIHAPLRLQICAMLSPVMTLPFADIRDSLHVSDSVVSKHLSALAEAGYVEVSRVRADSRSRRQVMLTRSGRAALFGHLAALQAIAEAAEPAIAEEPSAARAPGRRRARRRVTLDPNAA